MSNLSGLVQGLSQGLNGYLQDSVQRQNQNQDADAQLRRQEELAQYKNNLDQDNSQFTPSMGEAVAEGSGDAIEAYKTANGSYPTYDRGMKMLKAWTDNNGADDSSSGSGGSGGSSNQVSGQTLGTLLGQMGADPEDVQAVGKISSIPTGLATAFTSKVFKNESMTPAQLQMSYRAINPYMATKDQDSLSQDPDYNAFSSNMLSNGDKALDASQFPTMMQNAQTYAQNKMQAYVKQGLSQGQAYTKALTDASQIAAPYSRKVKTKLMAQLHLNMLHTGQQQQQQ